MKGNRDLTTVANLFICALILLSGDILLAQDWPMANGNRERTSRAVASNPQPPLHIAATISDISAGQISSYKGILYCGCDGEPNSVVAFDVATRQTLWTFDIPDTRNSIMNVPAVNEDLVLFGGHHATALYALNRATGTLAWSIPFISLYTRNIILDDDVAYVSADSLYCIALADGAVRWTYPLSAQTTPAVDDVAVYVNGKRKVVAVDKTTGQELWSIASFENSFGQVIVEGDVLYASDRISVRALSKVDGSILWSHMMPEVVFFSQLSEGCLALGTEALCVCVWEDSAGTASLHALDKTTGDQIWQYNFASKGVFSPTIVGSTVYVTTWQEKKLWGFDLADGSVTCSTCDGCTDQPVAADGMLYVVYGTSILQFQEGAADVDVSAPLPSLLDLELSPNPARDLVTIALTMQQREHVTVRLHDILGSTSVTIADGIQNPGVHQIRWSRAYARLAAGMYFVTAQTAAQSVTRNLLLLK